MPGINGDINSTPTKVQCNHKTRKTDVMNGRNSVMNGFPFVQQGHLLNYQQKSAIKTTSYAESTTAFPVPSRP
jgi:hypothetical protein